MKFLDKKETGFILNKIGMKIDEWNRVIPLVCIKENSRIVYQAPRDALLMYCFSQHIAGWLPKDGWKLLHIDDVNIFAKDEEEFFSRLVGGGKSIVLNDCKTLIFEQQDNWIKSNLTISYLVYALILFEGHGCIVSSAGSQGEMVCVQDGYLYFVSDKKRIFDAQSLINSFEKEPRKSPEWILLT
ncbi:MAG: hypothetical protein FWD62_15190 [Betaproteobacteria bacterium]|nr:hypothetical protein [Betaproteobacteria bacterium]